ncbi:MAG: tetratricopeptide repeat protein, partial [Candidatus Hodarchaeota archaeon]
ANYEGAQVILQDLAQNHASDIDRLSQTYILQGKLLYHQGNFKIALEKLKQAYLTSSAHVAARALSLSTGCYARMGEYDEALKIGQSALNFCEEHDLPAERAETLKHIAVVHRQRGDFPLALTCYNQSNRIYKHLNHKRGEAEVSNNIGYVLKQLGDLDNALHFFEKGMAIWEELNDKLGVSYALNNMAEVFYLQGLPYRALRYFQRSIILKQTCGDRYGLAWSLKKLAAFMLTKGSSSDIVSAEKHLKEAIDIFEEIGVRAEIYVDALVNLVELYTERGEFKQAEQVLHKAEQQAEEIASQSAKAFVSFIHGYWYQKQGHFDHARVKYYKCHEIASEISLFEYILRSLLQLAKLELSDYDVTLDETSLRETETLIETALEIAEDKRLYPTIVRLLDIHALLSSARFDFSESLMKLFVASEIIKEKDLHYLDHLVQESLARVEHSQALSATYDSVVEFSKSMEGQTFRNDMLKYVQEYIRETIDYLPRD